jgi:hypothetical protein
MSWQEARDAASVQLEMALRKERIAAVLLDVRLRDGLTQEQAAARAGVTLRQCS